MIIRRNVYFSAIDEQTGEERLYSTTEIAGEEREFAEKDRKPLAKAKNHISFKDLGTLGGSVMGAHYAKKAGNKAADEADAKGASDEEIVAAAKEAGRETGKKARKAAVAVGTAGYGAAGGIWGHALGKKKGAIIGTAVGAATGAGLGALSGKIDKRARGKMAEREARRRVDNRG